MRYNIPSDAALVTAGYLADKEAHVVAREVGSSKMRLEVASAVRCIVAATMAVVRHDCGKWVRMA